MRRCFVVVTMVLCLCGGTASADDSEYGISDAFIDGMSFVGSEMKLKLSIVSFNDDAGDTGDWIGRNHQDLAWNFDFEGRSARFRLAGVRGTRFALLDWDVDAKGRGGHIRFGAGDTRVFALSFDSKITFRDGGARIRGRLNLGVAGRKMTFDLPDITLVPKTYQGRRYMEYQVPLLEGRF